MTQIWCLFKHGLHFIILIFFFTIRQIVNLITEFVFIIAHCDRCRNVLCGAQQKLDCFKITLFFRSCNVNTLRCLCNLHLHAEASRTLVYEFSHNVQIRGKNVTDDPTWNAALLLQLQACLMIIVTGRKSKICMHALEVVRKSAWSLCMHYFKAVEFIDHLASFRVTRITGYASEWLVYTLLSILNMPQKCWHVYMCVCVLESFQNNLHYGQ